MLVNKIHTFIDCDLDGAGCYLLLKKLLKDSNISYTVCTKKTFINEYRSWNTNNKIEDYSKIFICDLDVSDHLDIVDKENFIIIDHHRSHIENINLYKVCKVILYESRSSTSNIIEKFKMGDILNKFEKLLFELISDYDSYELKHHPFSLHLNYVFWNYTGNRLEKFINDFEDGFKGFNTFHKNTIKLVEAKIEEFLNTAEIYVGEIPIGGKNRRVLSCFVDHNVNELAQKLLKRHQCELSIMINIKSKRVYLRRSPESDIIVCDVAKKLCDGGGHEASAGGVLTDNLIKITQAFNLVSNG
jgi:oligoribonuclease NrnB/cAMP/cGMP phosphodiesterase (DHH superfamily)